MNGIDPSPRDLAELTVRRLNRACNDLGLTLKGRPLFVLDTFVIEADAEAGLDEAIEIIDVSLNSPFDYGGQRYEALSADECTKMELSAYADLATEMERLAERAGRYAGRLTRDQIAQNIAGQMQLPGLEG